MRRALVLVLLASCGKAEPPAPPRSEAQKLLAEAGFPDGRGFPKLALLYNTSESHKKLAAAVQESWRKALGIEIELVNMEWKVYLDRKDRGDYDLARSAWLGEYLDPHAFLDLFTRESGSNSTGWSSDEYDALIRASDAEPDRAKRTALLEKAEGLLLEAAPIATVYHYRTHNLVKPFVKGVRSNARDMHPLQTIRLEGPDAPADGTLVYNSGEEPNSLDPALSHDIAGLKVLMNLFEGLANYDPGDASPVPAAAERWEISPDGRTWTFHLRPATWSNGDPLVAADFAFAWKRVVDPKTASTYAHRLFLIRNAREIARGEKKPDELGVKAVDERTLVVELVHPAPYFAQLVCLNLFYPVHRTSIGKPPKDWLTNGPYRLVEWRVNDRKVFVKNPRYRAAKDVALEKAVFVSVPDAARALAMYEAGQVHWLFQVPTDRIDQISKRPDFVGGPANSVYFYMFNTKRKPLDDPRVRRALSLTIDRESITRALLRGGETPADRLVPPPSVTK
ncbi:MAG TPA: ABC transporter substrate-binding protein [Planctomycetota bacterium]